MLLRTAKNPPRLITGDGPFKTPRHPPRVARTGRRDGMKRERERERRRTRGRARETTGKKPDENDRVIVVVYAATSAAKSRKMI